ncbi:FAD-binding protein, partial [bacterium]|nr:FAD-binding protein [bacterium]
GYQWPFDPRKIENKGSSLVDVLVYIETVVKGRRVYMDFRQNPQGDARLGQFRFEDLSEEAYTYLKNSKALFGTPIERLEHMNPIAIELYKKNGIDLHTEPLEVAVCAQHNNGGLKGDIWWESNIRHLFPVGEVNGSHGVYRPGGSALNSGQVGSIRAAQRIANVYTENEFDFAAFEKSAGDKASAYLQLMQNWATNSKASADLHAFRDEFQERMSKAGGHIRELSAVTTALKNAYKQMANRDQIQVKNRDDLPFAFQNRQLVLAHAAYLEAVKAYLEADGGSRGSYMVMDPNGLKVLDQLGEEWRYKADVPELGEKVLETVLSERNTFESRWVARRPIPEDEFWFENVWADYRAGTVFTQK